jgi:catechol 2,3-dioxygenase-like lactoylglutathione lyase family enzyme
MRGLVIALLAAVTASAHAPGFGVAPMNDGRTAAVTGLFNWIHSTSDIDRAVAFYRSVFGLDLVNSPFTTAPAAPASPVRPREEASSDPLVWDLTGTHGSRFRNAFMKLPGAAFGHELSEFVDIDQRRVRANVWDPGATMSIFHVRDVDRVVTALKEAGAEIITRGGAPVRLGQARAVVARDPDGHLVQAVESATSGAAIGLTVANLAATRRFYEDVLGFKLDTPASFERDARGLLGMETGEYRVSTARVPGTSIRVEFYEFRGLPTAPARWHFQDPGAPQLQFRVRDMDALLAASRRVGVPFVSAGEKPIDRSFGRFVFVTDPDGVFVEYVHPKP